MTIRRDLEVLAERRLPEKVRSDATALPGGASYTAVSEDTQSILAPVSDVE